MRFTDVVPRVAIFVSRLDHCLQDLLWRFKSGELQAELPMVISNHLDLRPLAGCFGVNYFNSTAVRESDSFVHCRSVESRVERT